MPIQLFSFDPGGSKRLEINWEGKYNNLSITLDDEPIGIITDKKTLVAGQEFKLPDGSILKLQLVSNLTGIELHVLRNGVPLPGSASNPNSRVTTAVGFIFLIAGLNLLVGLFAAIFGSGLFSQWGFSWTNLLFGVFFFAMGVLINRYDSKVALILAIVVFSLDTLLMIVNGITTASMGFFCGSLLRITLIIPMARGVSAITALKNAKKPLANLRNDPPG